MTLAILLNSALRMLLIGVVVWLVLRLVRARNPYVEALAWRMTLLAGFVLPALLYWGLAPSFDTVELPAIVSGAVARPGSAATAPAETMPTGLLASIYLVVSLLLLARLVAGLVGTWRVSRAAQPLETGDDVRISAQVRSPATFGTTILLPSDAQTWPAERLEPVLAHERAHVHSRDGYWSWLAQLHTAIFWFNPLAWWLQRRLEALAETTSDDAVVAARHDPIAYAELLLDFSRHPNSRSVAMSVAESNVSKRIERILARTPPAIALPRAIRWAAAALLVPAVVLAASTTQAESPLQPASAAAAVAPRHDGWPANAGHDGVKLRGGVDPDDYYPAAAKQQRVEGKVVVQVAVDAGGQVIDVRVVDVKPASPEYGFGEAAMEVARHAKFTNPRQDVSYMTFMVKFALQN
jgi:bla regulator protein blaR1